MGVSQEPGEDVREAPIRGSSLQSPKTMREPRGSGPLMCLFRWQQSLETVLKGQVSED